MGGNALPPVKGAAHPSGGDSGIRVGVDDERLGRAQVVLCRRPVVSAVASPCLAPKGDTYGDRLGVNPKAHGLPGFIGTRCSASTAVRAATGLRGPFGRLLAAMSRRAMRPGSSMPPRAKSFLLTWLMTSAFGLGGGGPFLVGRVRCQGRSNAGPFAPGEKWATLSFI